MEKRLPFAIFLSFLLVFFWAKMNAEPPGEGAPAGAPVEAFQPGVPGESPAQAEPPPEPPEPVVEAEERWIEWLEVGRLGEPGHYWARFDNRGALLRDLRIGGYWDTQGLDDEQRADRDHWTSLLYTVETDSGETGSMLLRTNASSTELTLRPLEEALWQHEIIEEHGVVLGVRFIYSPGTGVTFEKVIRTEPGAYHLRIELALRNDNPDFAGPKQFVFTPAACVPRETTDQFYTEPQAAVAWRVTGGEVDMDSEVRQDSPRELSGPFSSGAGPLSWAGVHNKYFAILLRAANDTSVPALKGASWRRLRDFGWARRNPEEADKAYQCIVTDIDLLLHVPEVGAESRYEFIVYAGPKDRDLLEADYADHRVLVEDDLGFFAGIASVLLYVLGKFQALTGNWGVAIILLTLSVRLLLFPVNRKSQVAMARHQTKMKRVQPKLDEVKQKYAKDPKKLRQEQARVMQEEGAFPPLGGCLPVFVQIPVFFGLFQALRTSFDLRQAPFFGWVKDLAKPDHMMRIDLDTHLPFIGTIEWLNVLPPTMVVLWILQQKVMPKPTDAQALKMQKMMMWMPVLFGFFLYNYAAGLSLYMITQSILGIMEQTVIKKIWPIDATEKPKKKSGFMARLSEMQGQAQKMQQQKKQAGRRPQSAGKAASRKKKRKSG